jgi:hypothetical protein
MVDRAAATALRILGARARLLGPGDGNSLQNINTTNLPDGSLCWVSASLAYFVLHKGDSTTPPDGINVIKPSSGPGRWFIQTNTGSGEVQIEDMTGLVQPFRPLIQTEGLHPVDTGTAIALLDGEVDALAYPSLSAAVTANTGRTIRLINGTHVVDANLTDATVVLRFLQGAVLSVLADRTIATGIDTSAGGIIVIAAGKTLTHSGPILAPDTRQLWDVSAAGASVQLSPGATDHVTPRMFGATGDYSGVSGTGHDDSDAIQAMIDTMESAVVASAVLDGKCQIKVDLQQGRYRITKQIIWTRLFGVTVIGAGQLSTLFEWDGSVATSPLTITDVSNTTPIVYETSAPHGLSNGNVATVQGIVGVAYTTKYNAGNRRGIATVVDPTHFSINGSVGNDAYLTGGQVWTDLHGVDTMWLCYNCRESRFQDFQLRVESGETNPPLTLFERRGDFSDPDLHGFVPTKVHVHDVALARGGIGLLDSYAAGSANNNNDQHTTERVNAEGQTIANFAIGLGPGGSAGSNMKANVYQDNRAVGGLFALMKWGGSFTWRGGYVRDHRTSFTRLNGAAVAATVLTVDSTTDLHSGAFVAIQESTGNRYVYADPEQYRTTIVSVDSPTQITVTDAVTAGDNSFVVDDYGDNRADFVRASSDNAIDGDVVDHVYCEASAHVFVDRFDVGTISSLPAPIDFRDVINPNTLPGTDNYACLLRRGTAVVSQGVWGDLSFPPARFWCGASGAHPSEFTLLRLKLFGSPLLGGGKNATNVEHLVTSGLAIVDDRDHEFGDGTSNPILKQNRPSRPIKADTTDALRAVLPPVRFDGDVIYVGSLKGSPFVWDSAAGANAWDNNSTQIRPTDIVSTNPGMWFAATERAYATDTDHLALTNADHQSVADLGAGTTAVDLIGGTYALQSNSTLAHDGYLVVAPGINGHVLYTAEDNLLAAGWARVNATAPDGTTLTDTSDVVPTAHSATYTITGLDTSGTVLTEFCVDVQSVLGSPIHRVELVCAGVWAHFINADTGTDTGSGLSVGGKPEIVATSDTWYRIRWLCLPTSTALTIYLASNTGLGTNSYIGTGTGQVKVRRVMAYQGRTAAGRFVRSGIIGTIGAPLPDSDTTIVLADGFNRTDRRAAKSANRTTRLGAAGAVNGDELTVYSHDQSAYYTRAYVDDVSGLTRFTTTVGAAYKLIFPFDGTNFLVPRITVIA